ncbi:hypothetical protein LIER_18135 [Lithospermum erythrorhizon]|uniref:Polyprotein n=1 Tax=Lithospermum erythrorhizon TaxID=34254 RepID=A0AAV3QG32_LITER
MCMNRMFIVVLEEQSTVDQGKQCLQATSNEAFKLWHERYGHISAEGMQTLQNKKLVIGLSSFKIEENTCADCLIGKQTMKSMPKQTTWKAKKVLELVHSDICGPITPISSSGKKYFLTFIDDYSRKGWAYLLANKSESGVAERINRTVMNMVRAMISAKKMLKVFWPKAVMWTFYLLNRCPTVSVDNMTPQQAFSGLKPAVDHLRVWGCMAHVHIPKVRRGKLDERNIKCIFLGVSEGSKGYRLFDVQAKRVITRGTGTQTEMEPQQEQNENETEEEIIADDSQDENQGSDVEEKDESSKSTNQGRAIRTTSGRIYRHPNWMKDYVSGNVLSIEEQINMVQEGDLEDSLTFEEASTHEKWRKAMDAEMNVIEKNNI